MEEEKTNNQPETAQDSKKESKFSGFIKKVSKKIDDAAYDSRLVNVFQKSHTKYQVFTGTGILSPNPEIYVEEHLDGEEKFVIMLGEDDNIKPGCLIRRVNDKPVYKITAVEPATLTVVFEGKSNQKNARKIVIGEQAEKVDVIKVGDEFYRV